MRAFVILATIFATTLARPDVSHLGYKYNQPHGGSANSAYSSSGASYNGGNNELETLINVNENDELREVSSIAQGLSSYDAPYVSGNNYAGNQYSDSASFGSSSSAVTTGGDYDGGFNSHASGAGHSSNGFSAVPSSGFSGSGLQSSGSDGHSSGFSGSSSSGFESSNGQNGGINLIQGRSQSFDLTGGSNGGQRVVYKPVIKQGEPIITKNFYVHAAPEEDENVRVEEKVQVVRPQKTYKIIFIKAPSSGSSISAANYPVYPQNEEKTIVYVLSKKDEQVSDIGEIPTPPPAVTHKPDVYFIKYKTKQEAANAVANIQSQYQQDVQVSAGSSAGVDGSNQGSRISEVDIRSGDSNSFNQGSYSDTADNGIQSFQASSQSQFGPNGEQVSIQKSSLGSNDGHSSTQTSYSDSTDAGHISSHATHEHAQGHASEGHITQGLASHSLLSDSSSSSAEFVPQNLVKLHQDQSSFRQSYLPPHGCSNC